MRPAFDGGSRRVSTRSRKPRQSGTLVDPKEDQDACLPGAQFVLPGAMSAPMLHRMVHHQADYYNIAQLPSEPLIGQQQGSGNSLDFLQGQDYEEDEDISSESPGLGINDVSSTILSMNSSQHGGSGNGRVTKRRKRGPVSPSQKLKRRAANRAAAQRCRNRKLDMLQQAETALIRCLEEHEELQQQAQALQRMFEREVEATNALKAFVIEHQQYMHCRLPPESAKKLATLMLGPEYPEASQLPSHLLPPTRSHTNTATCQPYGMVAVSHTPQPFF